jgi:hypothetical protein
MIHRPAAYLVRTPDGHDHGRDPDLAGCQRAADRLGPDATVERLDGYGCRTGEVVYTVDRPRRGRFGGLCLTEGCPNPATWIPISDAHADDPHSRYRCGPCCDRIAAGQPL